jgi:hypothetical protein
MRLAARLVRQSIKHPIGDFCAKLDFSAKSQVSSRAPVGLVQQTDQPARENRITTTRCPHRADM